MHSFSILLLLLLFSPLGLCRFTDVSGHNSEALEVSRSSRYRRESPPDIMAENHLYYTSNFFSGGKFADTWYDLSTLNDTAFHTELSDGYYLYDSVQLQFRFPFYGHYIQSVAITTHGFLSTADILHRGIYLTQYIAPFSADFNPSLSQSSRIHYISRQDVFIAQWSNMSLDTNQTAGEFTFQVQLRPDGEIIFVYDRAPLTIKETSKRAYPSFSGLADGFILNNEGRLYLYSYHNVTLPESANLTRSVYVLTPLPNCITATDVQSCNFTSCTSSFECGWCETLQLCSDGLDRRRQNWYDSNCQNTALLHCSAEEEASLNTSVVAVIVVIVVLLIVTPATVVFILLLVWAVWRYRKGRNLWTIQNQIVPKKSDQILLREPEDAQTS